MNSESEKLRNGERDSAFHISSRPGEDSAVPSRSSSVIERNAGRLQSELSSQHLASSQRDNRGTAIRGEQQESGSKHWTLTSEGFPPGVTVDELKKYRRRRQVDDTKPKDNLQPVEESLKSYESEYTRRFRAHNPGDAELFPTNRTREDNPESVTVKVLKRPKSNLYLAKGQPMESVTEKNSQYVPYANPERRKLLRKSTALKPEGEMLSETEVKSQFRMYDKPEKAVPIRRPPSLRLEGDFEVFTSEQKEKYIGHLLEERPAPRKKSTLLKMEGDFNFLTEKQVSYVEHSPSERPRPRKRSTSLKLDGEVEFFPEYRSSFIDFPRSRPITYKPVENLRNEGEIESQTETKTKFIDFQQFPIQLPARPANNLHMEGGFDIRPEYKENFIDFPRSRPFILRPENHLKQEGEMDIKTEKSEELGKILKEEVHRPLRARRQSNLRLEGEQEFSTEKREQFKGHDIMERLPPARRDGNLLLEGEFDFKTESEDKYVANPLPERSDFRKRSSFLQSGGEFRSASEYERNSPRRHLSPSREGQPVRTKLIPFKTEHYGFDSELMENCNRRSSRRNSKRLRETDTEGFGNLTKNSPFKERDSLKLETLTRKSPEAPFQPHRKDNLRLESGEQCRVVKSPMPFDEDYDILKKTQKDGNASDETSDTASVTNRQPSFRLEVYNVDGRPQGFHKGTQRVFPPEGIATETINFGPGSFLEERRNNYYNKGVDSPQVPHYLLDKNNNLGKAPEKNPWELTRAFDDKFDEFNNNGFTRPDHTDADDKSESSSTATERKTENWSRPNWLTT